MKGFLCLLLLYHSGSALVLTGPSAHAARLGSDALVPCTFTVDKPPVDPKQLTIIWLFQDKEILSYNETVRTTSSRYSLSSDALRTGVAHLTISSIRIPDGGMYKCVVIYSSDRKEKKLWLDIQAPPQVTITGRTVVLNKKSVLRCSITGFFPMDIGIKWLRGREMLSDITEVEPRRNSDGTYSVESRVTITPTEEDRERTFSCRIQHKYLQEPLQEDFQLVYEAPPQVTITGRTVVLNKDSVLRCSITGFHPVDIGIKWFKGRELLRDVSVDEPQRNSDGTYTVESSVTITPTEEDRERTFSCSIQHEFLQEPLQEDFQLVYEEGASAGVIAACVIVPMLIILIIIAAALWWKRKLRKANGLYIIRDIAGPLKLIAGEEAVLYCIVDNSPEEPSVTWLMRRAGEELEIQTSQMGGHEEEEERLLDKSYVIGSHRVGRQYLTSLIFTPHMERHRDVTFICRAVCNQQKDEKTFHRKTLYGKPTMSQPVMRSLLVSGEMKYLLHLERFYPKSINIVWTCGERGTEEVVSSTESPSENPDRTYNVSSEVRIPEERHKDPTFRVRVTWKHESKEEPESRDLSIRDSDYRWSPVVEEIRIPRLRHGFPAVLQCDISGCFPDAITVKWRRDPEEKIYEEADAAPNQSVTPRRASDNTYSWTASLTITPTLQAHQGAEYICLVDHPALEEPIERSTGRLHIIAEPQMLAPIGITIADSSRVQFSLNLQKFYPKEIQISWHWEDTSGTKYGLSPEQTLSNQRDLTYDVTSIVRISTLLFNDPRMEITVMWKHETMEKPENRSLTLRDLPWRPHVGPIKVTKLEEKTTAALTCDISGYFLDLLSVSWFIKQDGDETSLPIESSKTLRTYKISHKEKKQKDKSSIYEASLTFTTSINSDRGSEIICRVEHPSLACPIERSTGALHIDVKKNLLSSIRRSVKEAVTPGTKDAEVEIGQEPTEVMEDDIKEEEAPAC